ncbi:MAG: PUA domain-containing protein, partial [Planctomycetota bacterium]
LNNLSDAAARARDGEEDAIRTMVAQGECLASRLPRFVMDPGAVPAVAGGAKFAAVGLLGFEMPVWTGDRVALLSEGGDWIALGEAEMDGPKIMEGEQGIVASPRKVFRPPP